jgi:octaprenyl-diphosphate synthase
MSSIATAFTNGQPFSATVTLDSLFKPIVEQLEQTQELYNETVLATTERNYLQNLLSGESGSFIPAEFRVPVADRIANHLLQSQGKWIRAALVLLSAGACGVKTQSVRQVAVAVELIHLATLVHDDIIDEAPMRRGLPSIPANWGNSIAVLMGDFLFSKAFKLLLASESIPSQTLLTRATGQMCLGEIKQLYNSQTENPREQEYLEMIENKTASLMSAATASGAHLGELDKNNVERFHTYGHAVGMTFQITDDVLDYTASTNILGKERGGDLRNGKITLPLIHLFQHDSAVKNMIHSSASLEDKSDYIFRLMTKTGSFEYAYSVGRRYSEQAHESLNELEKSVGYSDCLHSLHNLIDFILARQR